MERRDKNDKEPLTKRLDAIVPEALKKAVAAGVGAVFLTEEGIRHAVGDMKLPKEALNFLLAQTDRTRKEIFFAVSKEVKKYLRSSELEKLLSGILQHLTVEVKAEIRFKADDKGGLKLEVKDLKTEVQKSTEDKEEI